MTGRGFLARTETCQLPLLADGAMGTMLHAQGVRFSACFDALNLTDPAAVARVHGQYLEAGSDILLSNTFGANCYKLADHGLADQVADINRAGVDLARRSVLASFRDVLVAGDVGPLGVRLVPYGRVQKTQARAAFAEQIRALTDAGADLIVIETMTDLQEILTAVQAAKSIGDLPVVACMTFTRDDRTLLGDAPRTVARRLWEEGADVVGVNCSGGPDQLLRIARLMRQAVPDCRLWVKPNAGWPEQVAGRIRYPATPAYFGDYVWGFRRHGACVVGGCCGTTPAHIAAMRHALDAGPPSGVETMDAAQAIPPLGVDAAPDQTSHLSELLGRGGYAISVEVDPPRGLSTHRLVAAANLVKEAGADVINVADSPMARMRMSPWAVCALVQDKVHIETTLHFPTRGRSLLRVQGDLLAAHALGIRNVFVVMGDPTAIGDYPEAMDDYDVVPSGLIRLIKQGFNSGVDQAGADIGQPTAYFVGAALSLGPDDVARELKVLRRKVRAGVDFLLTQPVYDADSAAGVLSAYDQRYGPLEVPLLVGILPLYGVRHARFLDNEVPGISVPSALIDRLDRAGDAAPQEGVRIAAETIEAVRPWTQGIYLVPAFGRYDLAADVITSTRLET